jgi:hypothetical protein
MSDTKIEIPNRTAGNIVSVPAPSFPVEERKGPPMGLVLGVDNMGCYDEDRLLIVV